MGDYKRLALLVLIMIGVCLIVGATAVGMIYEEALHRERERLVNIAQSQARLMEALAHLEARDPTEGEQPSAGALLQILEAHRLLREQGVGQTAEVQLARRDGDLMVYLTPARGSNQPHDPVAFGGPVAEPMTAALSGRSGTMIGRDYAGRRALAAFEPVPQFGLGLVAKIDMAEINQRYTRAGVIAGFVSLAAVLGAALLFFRVGEPMIRRLRESESHYRELFDNMDIGVAVYHARSRDGDFIFKDFNCAGEHIARIDRRKLIGRSLTEIFPGVREFGLIEVLKRVSQTGKTERLPTRYYRDERIEGWRDFYVYKLPSGEIITLFSDVSERERQAEALRQNEQRYRNLVEAQPDPICQFLPDTTLTFVNRAYAQFYGTEPEKLIGKRWLDFAAKEERPRFLDELSSFTPDHPERHEETRSTRADREVRWYLCHLYGFFDDRGKILSFQTFGTDITARKRGEDALRESEARYRTVGEAIPFGVWVCNADGGVEYVSQSFLDLIGKTLDDVKPRGWLDRLPPEDLKPTLVAWRECVRTGSAWKWEHRVRGTDGLYRTILSLGRPVRDEQGRITSWGGFNLDISDRKRAEEALAKHVGLLTAITDSAADAIFVSDAQGRVTLMNPAAERIFGWSRKELTGQMLHDAIHDRHPDGSPYPASECPLRRVYVTGEILLRHEDVFFRKDGSQVQVACSNAPLMIEGRIAGSVLVAHDISDRKRREQALRESEARLRRTVEHAPFPVMVHAEDGEIVHISKAWLDLTGYAREEIATIAAWTERAYGEREDMMRAKIDRLYLIDEALDEGEYVIRTADGRARVWAFSSAPLGSDSRGRRLVVSMAADVTDRKAAERALSESEVRMRALLDASQDEILLLSADGTVLAINKAAQRRLARRLAGADPVGAHLDRLLPRDQVESRMAIVRQVASTAALVHCDVPIRSRWFEFWFYPVLEPDRPVSEVAVYAREITQQKKSQADLGKLFQAIQQSPMSVVITDRSGRIEYVNPEFTKATGYTLAEAIGQNPRILKSEHTPHEQYVELWKTISSGGVWRGELINRKKTGELFCELVSIAPVKDGETITNFVAVKEDITHRKEMEEQLRQSQKMEALGQLTGGIAHDFNNLLAIITGNLQLLNEQLTSDPKIHAMLEDAIWSARRAGELTRRLLAFARRQPLKPDIINLNEVIGDMTELLRRTLGAGIRIEECLAPDLWQSLADRGELERALVNLAVNSRDAMRTGGTLTLETRNAFLDDGYAEQYEEVTPGEYVLVAVTDNGTGMPPEITERVFEPFFTTKEVGQGSGLGLSMVYGFVKQSGGHISIYSRVGQGTCVKLYLPRAPAEPDERKAKPRNTAAEALEKKVILVVEDEPKLRKVAVKMLDRLGLESMQAETAKAALDFLADGHIDVLFTDIELPGGMNGAELAHIAQNLYPDVKVLFTTGYAKEAILHERGAHEHAPWLLKPYSHRELARELKNLFVQQVH
jgi:PAS domain S-box-containing protein